MDWFLYDNSLHHERINKVAGLKHEACNFIKKEAIAHVFSC